MIWVKVMNMGDKKFGHVSYTSGGFINLIEMRLFNSYCSTLSILFFFCLQLSRVGPSYPSFFVRLVIWAIWVS